MSCGGRPPGVRGWLMDSDLTLLPEVLRTGIFEWSEAVDCRRSLSPWPALLAKVCLAVVAAEFSVTERV